MIQFLESSVFDMKYILKLLVFVSLHQCVVAERSGDKRLLLGSNLSPLEQEFQELKSRTLKLESSFAKLESENKILKTQLNDAQNALKTVYFIWGRKQCPTGNGTSTVYSGVLAGKHYAEKGSGTNILCLPHNPDPLPQSVPVHLASNAQIWGSEYEYNIKTVAVDDDVPCSMCLADGAVSEMFPAKLSCPSGWRKQYNGFLIASRSDEYASEYICVDDNPEYFEGTRTHNDNGRPLYPVRAKCGSLPCPPYVQSQFVTCVVCSLLKQ